MDDYVPKNVYSKSVNDHLDESTFVFTKIENPPQQVLIGDDVLSLDENENY
jgi:hypothetical protein